MYYYYMCIPPSLPQVLVVFFWSFFFSRGELVFFFESRLLLLLLSWRLKCLVFTVGVVWAGPYPKTKISLFLGGGLDSIKKKKKKR